MRYVRSPVVQMVPNPATAPIAWGDGETSFSLPNAVSSPTVKTVSMIALTYHGYARTGSILWALFYGLCGRLVPVAAVPISIAQGFGKRKTCDL